jgi:hypothetical protein
VQGGRIVDAENVDRLDLEVGVLELRYDIGLVVEHPLCEAVCLTHAVDDPVESARCVRSREDVLVHAERAAFPSVREP